LETFVDPQRFRGTVYRAANWVYVGNTKGFRRTRFGYTATPQTPKRVFLQPLRADAGALLAQAVLPPPYQIGGSKIMLSAAQMQSLPAFFRDLPDPRRAQGRRHRLSTVLGIAAGAVLCGMRGYRAIADWAQSLGQKSRERFGCRREKGRYVVPSESILRNVLIRVDPAHLDRALRRWNEAYAGEDESLALDAIDIAGKDITADALLTQRKFATYLVEERHAHYYFTVKGNQPGLLEALQFYFQDRGQPHFVEHSPPDHGRIETRKIWTTTALNAYLDFPYVGQAFVIERHVTHKKTGEYSREIAYGITSRPPAQACPQRILQVNRGHWVVENSC